MHLPTHKNYLKWHNLQKKCGLTLQKWRAITNAITNSRRSNKSPHPTNGIPKVVFCVIQIHFESIETIGLLRCKYLYNMTHGTDLKFSKFFFNFEDVHRTGLFLVLIHRSTNTSRNSQRYILQNDVKITQQHSNHLFFLSRTIDDTLPYSLSFVRQYRLLLNSKRRPALARHHFRLLVSPWGQPGGNSLFGRTSGRIQFKARWTLRRCRCSAACCCLERWPCTHTHISKYT